MSALVLLHLLSWVVERVCKVSLISIAPAVLETMQRHVKVQCKTWLGSSALSRAKPCSHFFLDIPDIPMIADVNTGAQWASTPGSHAPKACAPARLHRCPLPKHWHVPTWNETCTYISEMKLPLWRKGCERPALTISFLITTSVFYYGKILVQGCNCMLGT